MLGIDPKTLRNWLKHANCQFAVHPTDARLKCLTLEQVQQLAALHGRPLPSSSQGQAQILQEPAPTLIQKPLSLLCSGPKEEDLRQVLVSLESKVATMQEQLAGLALELLRERGLRYERRLTTLETLVHQTMRPDPVPQTLQETNVAATPCAFPRPERHLLAVELQARSRVIPLIEYGAQGLYVAVCPQEGVLPFAPESAEWFDWLASLTSFRFVGPQGRFTAYRDTNHGQPTRGWVAHRGMHGHHYKHWLGVTDRLTITRLEQMAAKLQSHLAAL
jgi:hypothetical protein